MTLVPFNNNACSEITQLCWYTYHTTAFADIFAKS